MWGDAGQLGNAQSAFGNNPVNYVDPFGEDCDNGVADFPSSDQQRAAWEKRRQQLQAEKEARERKAYHEGYKKNTMAGVDQWGRPRVGWDGESGLRKDWMTELVESGPLVAGGLAKALAGVGRAVARAGGRAAARWTTPSWMAEAEGLALSLAEGEEFFVINLRRLGIPECEARAAYLARRRGVAKAPFGMAKDGEAHATKVLEEVTERLNNLKEHLTEADVKGAIAEMKGSPITKSGGDPYQHVKEVSEALQGTVNQIEKIKGALSHEGVTAGTRDALQKQLSEASKNVDLIKNALSKAN